MGLVYKALTFGLRSASLLFSAIRRLALGGAKRSNVGGHYIDDFVTLGAPDSQKCVTNVFELKALCEEEGLPTEPEKTMGLQQPFVLGGWSYIDTVKLEIRRPADKLRWLKTLLEGGVARKYVGKYAGSESYSP